MVYAKIEVEVKIERRPGFLHLSLGLNLNLPITLADFFSILLTGKSTHELRLRQDMPLARLQYLGFGRTGLQIKDDI